MQNFYGVASSMSFSHKPVETYYLLPSAPHHPAFHKHSENLPDKKKEVIFET